MVVDASLEKRVTKLEQKMQRMHEETNSRLEAEERVISNFAGQLTALARTVQALAARMGASSLPSSPVSRVLLDPVNGFKGAENGAGGLSLPPLSPANGNSPVSSPLAGGVRTGLEDFGGAAEAEWQRRQAVEALKVEHAAAMEQQRREVAQLKQELADQREAQVAAERQHAAEAERAAEEERRRAAEAQAAAARAAAQEEAQQAEREKERRRMMRQEEEAQRAAAEAAAAAAREEQARQAEVQRLAREENAMRARVEQERAAAAAAEAERRAAEARARQAEEARQQQARSPQPAGGAPPVAARAPAPSPAAVRVPTAPPAQRPAPPRSYPPVAEAEGMALHSAVRWNKPLAVIEPMILHAGFANFRDPKNGNRPLHIAAQNGHADVCAALLRGGAEVDAQNGKGNTAMHMAVAYEYDDVVALLAKAGADGEVLNQAGNRARNGIDGDMGEGAVVPPVDQVRRAKSGGELAAAFAACQAAGGGGIDKAELVKVALGRKKEGPAVWTADADKAFKAALAAL